MLAMNLLDSRNASSVDIEELGEAPLPLALPILRHRPGWRRQDLFYRKHQHSWST